MRALAGAEVGSRVRVLILVHEKPLKVVLPQDLRNALQGEGMLEVFQSFAPGKQTHIVSWIEGSARPETRAKRIQLTVEITHLRHEKQIARARKSRV